MSNNHTCLIAMTFDSWIIAYPDTDGDIKRETVARSGNLTNDIATLADALIEKELRNTRLCIGLSSELIYTAPIRTEGLPRKRRYQAMAYRFEEQLPVDAEHLTVSFVPAVGDTSLGIAVDTGDMETVLRELLHHDIHVESVRPTSLLALSQAEEVDDETDCVIVESGDGLELIRLEAGKPCGWHRVTHDPAILQRTLYASLLTRPVDGKSVSIATIGSVDEAIRNILRHDPDVELTTSINEDPIILATRAADRAVRGHSAGWGELRHGNLTGQSNWQRLGRPLQTAMIAACIFLVVLTVGLLIRSYRYHTVCESIRNTQADVFREFAPHSPVPVNVHSRLESEWRRRSAQSGCGTDVPQQVDALDSMRRIIAQLPESIRLRVTQVRVDPTDVTIEGQTRSHGDAETVSVALRQAGFAMEPPRTEHLAGEGVAFTLFGKIGPSPISAETAAVTVDAKGATP